MDVMERAAQLLFVSMKGSGTNYTKLVGVICTYTSSHLHLINQANFKTTKNLQRPTLNAT